MKKNYKKTKSASTDRGEAYKNQLSGDELWNAFSAGITPLKHKELHTTIAVIDTLIKEKKPITLTLKKKSTTLYQSSPAQLGLTNFSHGTAPGLDRQSVRKMRRGKMQIEARLDLHGMRRNKAYMSLLNFLEHAYISKRKTVLVITGKGSSVLGEVGVLKQAVPRWLNEQPIKTWIRGFDYAAPNDGGDGALYILIRRRR